MHPHSSEYYSILPEQNAYTVKVGDLPIFRLFSLAFSRLTKVVVSSKLCETMKQKGTKKGNQSTVVSSFTIEPELLASSKMLAKVLGYGFSYSAYVCGLLRRDLESCRRNPTPDPNLQAAR